ncbi:RNA methyltransferase, TrmA family [Lachnospiraceae bacterium TWA4]|nr:RNA methyltransferase, TrmA family [Lachnospiraceae bacterium TWA4]
MSTVKQIVLSDGNILKKNELITISIDDMSETGEGIGKVYGYTFFVKHAVTGDVVFAQVTKLLKNYGYARTADIITPSKYRVKPACPIAKPCGGCQLQELSYEGQLEFKYQKVKNHLERLGGFKDLEVLPVKGMKAPYEPYHYRNKSQYPVQVNKNGEIVMGFYAGRTHNVIQTEKCLLNMGEDAKILAIVKEWMMKHHVPAYDEARGKGIVRHVMIRYGKYTNQIMVCLVVTKEVKLTESLVSKLLEIDGMTSICLNINSKKTNVILGDEMIDLYGDGMIVDKIGEISYQISAKSFYQVNPIQTKVLYDTALDYAGLTGDEIVWDVYCGIGTISLFLAQKAKKVYGVEIVPAAIENAKVNAKLNHIENAQFFCGKAEEVLPKEYKEHQIYADVIVVDPPRKGCEEVVLETMVKMESKRIVYVSCNSATLARDAKYLVEHGYQIEKVQPVDMFPQTVHVETVCLLSRKDK